MLRGCMWDAVLLISGQDGVAELEAPGQDRRSGAWDGPSM
jgi:hypothetical protein